MTLSVISYESMIVKCNHCKTTFETNTISNFREFNTIPPSVGFMCPECNNMAKIHYADLPNRLKAKLLSTVSQEISTNGNFNNSLYDSLKPFLDDNQTFKSMKEIK